MNPLCSVLLVDDDLVDCQSILRMVTDADLPYRLTTVHSLAEARRQTAAERFDVAILDYELGDGTGLDLLPELGETATIILTGAGSEHLAAEALRLQASHYMVKDAERGYLHLLPATIEHALARRQTQYELRRYARELEREVEQRRQAESGLQREKARLHQILNLVPAMVFARDGAGRFLLVNLAVADACGVAVEQLVGADPPPATSVLHAMLAVDRQVLRTRLAKFVPEQSIVDCSGQVRYVQTTTIPFESAETGAVLTVSVDITHRKRLEERFHATVESAPTAMVMIDPEGVIVLVNAQTEQLFGYVRNELLGQAVEILLPQRFRNQHPRLRNAFFCAPTARRMGASRELFGLRKDGTEFPVEIGLNPIKTEEGQFVLSAIMDLTQRKMAEEQILRHQAELAHVARLSTMGELATGLAHEINQPLYAITNYARGCIQRLQSVGFNPDELSDALAQVMAEAERASEIIRRLRNFVLKRGPRRSSVNMNELIREVVQLSTAELHKRAVAVELHLADDLPLLLADSIQIQQVVLNLIRNALESFEDSASPRIVTIETHVSLDTAVEVVVCDNGRGLAAEEAESIFAPFYSTKLDGLGMGLSISRSIVEAHGGRLWANPAPGRGAMFHFTLPLAAEDVRHA